MKVRHKVILVSVVSVFIAVMVIFFLVYNILLLGFIDIENSRVEDNVRRVTAAVRQEVDSLDIICRDYANWDATYDYVLGENKYYTELDLSPDTLYKMGIYSMAILENNGTVIYAKGFINGTETELSGGDEFYEFYKLRIYRLIQHSVDDNSTGLITTPQGAALFSSRPILTTNGTGPVYGTLVMIKLMDDRWMQKMALQTGVKATFHEYDPVSGQMPQDLMEIKQDLPVDAEPVVRNINENLVVGYSLLVGADRIPNTIIKTWSTRDIYLQGKAAMKYFLASLLILGALFVLIMLYYVDNLFTYRLKEMKEMIIRVRQQRDSGARIDIKNDDELASFAKSMNDTFDSMEKISEERQAIFNMNPDTFIRTSPSSEVIDYKLNEPFKGMNISVGKSVADIFSNDVLEKILAAVLESETKGIPAAIEFPMDINNTSEAYSDHDGKSYVELRVVSMNDKGHLMILRDMTHRKMMELEILEKNKDLGLFNKFATDRELKMINLKKDNDALRAENEALKKKD